MAYIPNEWKDQVVQRPKTYQMNNNDDGSVTLIDSFGLVTELGTPVNQDYMNHIEQGIAGCAIRYYSTTETFKDKEAVLNVNEDGGIELWQSLTDNNLGNPLTDETKWQEVSLGGSGLPIGSLYPSFAAAEYVPEFALSCDATEYSSTQFSGLWTGYLTAATPKLLTKNYTQYQAEITATGKCAAFGVEHTISSQFTGSTITGVSVTAATWETVVSAVGSYVFSYDGSGWSLDSSAVELATYGVVIEGSAASGDTVTITYAYGDSFKVPYIPDGTFIQQALSNDEAGKAYEAGLPNVEGSFRGLAENNTNIPDNSTSGAFKASALFNSYESSGSSNYDVKIISFDASASNPIYGNSTTVQPESVALRWFVVVANAAENEAAMDWSQWASSLPYVTETYWNDQTGYRQTGYRVWSNGFCEQWMYILGTAVNYALTVELLKPYKNKGSWSIQITTDNSAKPANYFCNVVHVSKTASTFEVTTTVTNVGISFFVYTAGYIE